MHLYNKCDIAIMGYPRQSSKSHLALKTALIAESYEEEYNYGREGAGAQCASCQN